MREWRRGGEDEDEAAPEGPGERRILEHSEPMVEELREEAELEALRAEEVACAAGSGGARGVSGEVAVLAGHRRDVGTRRVTLCVCLRVRVGQCKGE